MTFDIYFANNRLSITTSAEGGFCVTPDPTVGIFRATLLDLFERHHWVTIEAANDGACEAIYHSFEAQFVYVVAAGGVVRRDDGAALMIYRNGRWDLPKGHWEEGETIEECALREVEEESGVRGLTLHHEICQTLHAYYMFGRWEIKRTHWYAMSSNDTAPLTPQTEEGISRAEWIASSEIGAAIAHSFPTIKSVMGSL